MSDGYAVLFPGQGSQFVGMGADLFAARPDLLGDAADEILGWSLRATCLEGPEEILTRTDRAQAALFALSYALWEELAGRAPSPVAAAGHSLGQYTALAAAGAFDFATGLRLVAARGRAMAEAAEAEPSGMVALLGTDAAAAEDICARRRAAGGRLWVANVNAPGQVVVAGAAADTAWLVDEARALGVRRAIPLKVAGAFHTPFMAGAADALAGALEGVPFAPPAFPVWDNATARPFPADDPVGTLTRQLVSPVRFGESLEGMAAAGAGAFVHVGPGDVTAGMARRSVPDAAVLAVTSLAEAGDAAGALAAIQ